MTSIKLPYSRARARLDHVRKWANHAEAFLLSMFLTEKIIRRTLVQLVIWKGSTPVDAFKTVKKLQFWQLKEEWKKYDEESRSLNEVIEDDNWNVIDAASKKRNDLVHGSGHEAQNVYRKQLEKLLPAHDEIKRKFAAKYSGFYGWRGMTDAAGNLLTP